MLYAVIAKWLLERDKRFLEHDPGTGDPLWARACHFILKFYAGYELQPAFVFIERTPRSTSPPPDSG